MKPLNPETIFSNQPASALGQTIRAITTVYAANLAREQAGYLPTQVTLRVQGDVKLIDLEQALAGKFELYTDCTEALCLRTVEAGNAHRELLKRERAARDEALLRHERMCREDAKRNVANNYMAPIGGITAGVEPPDYRDVPSDQLFEEDDDA